MKHLLALVAALLVTGAASISEAQSVDRRTSGGSVLAAVGRQFSARVVSVIDGDTLDVVTADRRSVRIRLEGIDCPERGTPFSNRARNFTRQLAFDKTVHVKVLDVDRYGRLVARVTSEGKDVSVELVTAGLASHYTVFSFDKRLEAGQLLAQKERRGMWANGIQSRSTSREPSAASKAREAVSPPSAEGPFFANVRSRVYHATTCRNATCKNCTREFRTQAEAQAAGFRPAGDCLKARQHPEKGDIHLFAKWLIRKGRLARPAEMSSHP